MATFIELIAHWNGGRQKGAQTALSKKIGVSQSTISRWMAGTMQPEVDLRPRLAKVLGVSEQELNAAFPKDSREDAASFKALSEPVPVVASIKGRVLRFLFFLPDGRKCRYRCPSPRGQKSGRSTGARECAKTGRGRWGFDHCRGIQCGGNSQRRIGLGSGKGKTHPSED
jgi:transcriptional regulator with XRE-family HTH domain